MRYLRNATGFLGLITAALVCGCASRSVGVDGGSQFVGVDGGSLPGDGEAACSCKASVSGNLHGSPVTFDHAAYGVMLTWGTHAHPVSPEAAVALELQLSDGPISCPGDGSQATFSGPRVTGIVIQTARQELDFGWVEPSSGPDTAFIDGELCFAALPVQPEEPLGRPVNKVLDQATGCLKLRFSDYDGKQQYGEVSGGFVASYCAALDSAMGE